MSGETLLGLRKGLKAGPEQSRGTIGPGITKTGGGQVVVKHEELPAAQPVPDDASDRASRGEVSKVEPNELFDASFDEFTADELSILP